MINFYDLTNVSGGTELVPLYARNLCLIPLFWGTLWPLRCNIFTFCLFSIKKML